MKLKNYEMNMDLLQAVRHSPVHNYVIPGLTSWLIGAPSPNGVVRLFECSRDHQENITPHSHRFDFQCLVLAGEVRNRVWKEHPGVAGDLYQRTRLTYDGSIGRYTSEPLNVRRFVYADDVYLPGQWYSMQAHEIHSIYFARNTVVLFFEGPPKSDSTDMLEPWVDGEVVPTFEVKPWMFKREAL